MREPRVGLVIERAGGPAEDDERVVVRAQRCGIGWQRRAEVGVPGPEVGAGDDELGTGAFEPVAEAPRIGAGFVFDDEDPR